MAITTKQTSPSQKEEPVIDASAGQAENEAVNNARTAVVRRKRTPFMVPDPGGRRVDATKYLYTRYTMQADSNILGDVESILTDEWKRAHGGWTYQWPTRTSNRTSALVRAGWFVPVPRSALSEDNPNAAISTIKVPSGDGGTAEYIIWMQHLLVAVPPDRYMPLVGQYEDYARARLMNNAEAVESALESANPGYDAQVKPFVNQRRNKTGE